MVKFLVERKSDDHDTSNPFANREKQFSRYIVFQEMLSQMIGMDSTSLDEDDIFEKLLAIQNFEISVKNNSVVASVKLQHVN